MFYKFKTPIVLFLGGMIFQIFGAWSKITHQAYANKVLTVGMFTQLLALIIALFIVVRTKKQR